MIQFLTTDTLKHLPVSAETRKEIEHLQTVIGKTWPLPMINPNIITVFLHDGTQMDIAKTPDETPEQAVRNTVDRLKLTIQGYQVGKEQVALVPTPSTANLNAVIDEIDAKFRQIERVNSIVCHCAEQYETYQVLLREMEKEGHTHPKRERDLEREAQKIDTKIKRLWGDAIPSVHGADGSLDTCPYCHKPYPVNGIRVFLEKGFREKVIALLIGGDFPINAWPLVVHTVYSWLNDNDLIPPSKKKAVETTLTTLGIQNAVKGLVTHLTHSEPTGFSASPVPVSANSTPTMESSGDSARPTWTPDSPPPNDSSITDSGSSDTLN